MPMFAKRRGNRVVCGVSGCGAELAHISGKVLHNLRPVQLLVFPMGWAQRPNGVWERTRRARHIDAHNRRLVPRTGQPLLTERHAEDRVWHGPIPGPGWTMRDIGEAMIAPWNLPADCRCPMPKCGWRQTLDPELLGVDPNLRAGRDSWDYEGSETVAKPSGLLVNRGIVTANEVS